jgi:hypothetical protein
LRHILSEDGIIVYPEKIEAITGWPMPRNVTEVRSFIGLSSYCKPNHFFAKEGSEI